MNRADIIKRLEEATGPSRELDALVWIVANPEDCDLRNAEICHDGLVTYSTPGFAHVVQNWPRKYTASIDDAVALCEQMLPGHGRLHSKGRLAIDEPLFGVKLYEHELCVGDDPFEIAEAEHNSEPMALLIALFRALEAQEASNAG